MKLTFLGTGAGAPARNRNVSAMALQHIQQSKLWLFDCGEGTQQQVLRSSVKLSQLERVFITHLHGDHLFGLPGLLASRSLQQSAMISPVTIYGPPGIEEYVQTCLGLSATQLAFPLDVVTVQSGLIYEDERLSVICAPLQHRVTDFGYAVIEKPQAGRFDRVAAEALGIPAGPLYAKLKNGETVTLENGTIIDGATLVGPARPGRKVVYCCDTVYCQAAIDLAHEADVLVHEATFAHADLEVAVRSGHSTARQAAEVAQAASVKLLILTHFSVRYDAKDQIGVEGLLQEAQTVFPNTVAAQDFWHYTILHTDPQTAEPVEKPTPVI